MDEHQTRDLIAVALFIGMMATLMAVGLLLQIARAVTRIANVVTGQTSDEESL